MTIVGEIKPIFGATIQIGKIGSRYYPFVRGVQLPLGPFKHQVGSSTRGDELPERRKEMSAKIRQFCESDLAQNITALLVAIALIIMSCN